MRIGQILCSSATAEVAESEALVDLGEHRLRDLDGAMHVFQIGDRSFPPLRSLDAFPGNLPIQLTPFVGRQDELASLTKTLESSRLVTLTGTGGVGKTRLALHAAAHLVGGFPDGVWLCELAAAGDAESMRQVVAAVLGYTPASVWPWTGGLPSPWALGACWWSWITASTSWTLWPSWPRRSWSVARRWPSWPPAGRRSMSEASGSSAAFPPGPQAGAALDQVAAFDAARLFLERVEATGADPALGSANGPAIAEICRRLDGIPLAIELAAARIVALAPGEIAAHLDERSGSSPEAGGPPSSVTVACWPSVLRSAGYLRRQALALDIPG
jgi:hypothetical protein